MAVTKRAAAAVRTGKSTTVVRHKIAAAVEASRTGEANVELGDGEALLAANQARKRA
jgi:hypothetical protein